MYRQALEQLPLPAATCAADGVLVFTNDAFNRYFKHDPARGGELRIDEMLEGGVTLLRDVGIERQMTARIGNGETAICSAQLTRLTGVDHVTYLLVCRDLTIERNVAVVQEEFISVVTHELRTPLTSIVGALRMLSSGVVASDPQKVQSLIDVAERNSLRLGRLIDDILDVERLGSDRVDMVWRKLDLVELVAESVRTNAPYGARFGVEFVFDQQVPSAVVNGDPDRLQQVMANLVSNAAKYSPSGEQVGIRIARVGRNVRVEVSDKGKGIPDAFRGRVFERFAQADSSTTRSKGGTGLGLAICKGIVELHHGEIGFLTTSKGTTFHFTIPIATIATLKLPTYEGNEVTRNVAVVDCMPDVREPLGRSLSGFGVALQHVEDVDAAIAHGAIGTKQSLDAILVPVRHVTAVPGAIRALRMETALRPIPILLFDAEVTAAGLQGNLFAIADRVTQPIAPALVASLASGYAARAGKGRARTLAVFQQGDVAAVLEVVLHRAADVVSVSSSAEARKLLRSEAFDLVIACLEPPFGDADLIRAIAQSGVPCVAVSNGPLSTIIYQIRDALVATPADPEFERKILAALQLPTGP